MFWIFIHSHFLIFIHSHFLIFILFWTSFNFELHSFYVHFRSFSIMFVHSFLPVCSFSFIFLSSSQWILLLLIQVLGMKKWSITATNPWSKVCPGTLTAKKSALSTKMALWSLDPSMEIEFGAKNWKESLYMAFVGPQILDFCYFLSLMAKFTFTIPWEVSW